MFYGIVKERKSGKRNSTFLYIPVRVRLTLWKTKVGCLFYEIVIISKMGPKWFSLYFT